MNEVTVKRNWKRKIEALCKGVTSFKSYSLSSNFKGVEVPVDNMFEFVMKELSASRHTKFRYDKDTGACYVSVHSNLWFQWVNKIDW